MKRLCDLQLSIALRHGDLLLAAEVKKEVNYIPYQYIKFNKMTRSFVYNKFIAR
jgi:hypothetical protein